jgi:hypothetical protein
MKNEKSKYLKFNLIEVDDNMIMWLTTIISLSCHLKFEPELEKFKYLKS